MQQELHFEHGDLNGEMAVTLANGQTLDDFCQQYLPDYNRDRFEAFAIRVFLARETVITIYAVDKIRQEDSSLNPEKMAVKKFKLNSLPLDEVLAYVGAFNCTLTNGNYALQDMEVVNK